MQKVFLKSRSGKISEGQVSITTWTKGERPKRALKFGGLTWLAAVVCVVLPIVHFLLVPLLLLAGPIVGVWNYRRESIVDGGDGICPYCGEKVTIGRGPDKWPIDELCTKCQNNFSVSKSIA